MDAAVAANAVIGVMQPVLNGIGGDLFCKFVWMNTRQRTNSMVTMVPGPRPARAVLKNEGGGRSRLSESGPAANEPYSVGRLVAGDSSGSGGWLVCIA